MSSKNYNWNIDSDMLNTLLICYNNGSDAQTKFKLLDCCILSLARSFHNSGNVMYISNTELGKLFGCDEKTIRRSIEKLEKTGLIKKIRRGMSRRELHYQPGVMERLKNKYNSE